MNSTPTSKAIEPQDALIARADERLAHAHEQIARADEELTRLSEQVAKMEREAAHPRSAEPGPSPEPGPQSPPRRPALRALVGLPLAAGIVVAGLVLYSSYGSGAKLLVARWVPQRALTPSLPSLPPENPPLPAQPASSTVQVAAAEAAPPQATLLAQTAPQDAASTATPAPPDPTQLLQTMARDLANLERNIEQLRANQQQIASDNSKAIEALKASQEEIKRVLARVSEQNLPKTSSPPTQPTPNLRRPDRTLQSPHVRARPRIPREWMYDDW
jgi:hypothetical protein